MTNTHHEIAAALADVLPPDTLSDVEFSRLVDDTADDLAQRLAAASGAV